jgi:hypothetical protein
MLGLAITIAACQYNIIPVPTYGCSITTHVRPVSRMVDGTKHHATFWFDDGDLTLTLQHSFRLHAPLLFRNSRAFALWPTQNSDNQGAVNCRLVSVPDEIGLEESDFVVFLEQIYDRGLVHISH